MRATDLLQAAEPQLEALVAAGPDPVYRDQLMLYGQFVGSWDFEWRGKTAPGQWRSALGEWHFFWGLNGRAVIDTWICPSRNERLKPDAPKDGEYGLTVRFYDPQLGAWRVTWNGPAYGNVRRFTARLIGDEIVQENLDNPAARWVFSEIRPEAYRWRSDLTADGGATWELVEEMRCRRMR